VTYRIAVTRDALRVLAKLDKPIRRRIQTAIDRLADDPRPHGVIALRGLQGAYRIRIADCQVIYTVDDGELLVPVVDLGHRSEIYRGL
jgi:mRNA interferase RelE/StbE